MMSERDAVRRQSDVILESVTADERLWAALLKIEDLTIQLSQQTLEYQQEAGIELLHIGQKIVMLTDSLIRWWSSRGLTRGLNLFCVSSFVSL